MFGFLRAPFADRRLLAEVRMIRIALQEISTALQAGSGNTTGTSFHSYYQSDAAPDDASALMQDEEDFAKYDRLEREKLEAGFQVKVDDELIEEE